MGGFHLFYEVKHMFRSNHTIAGKERESFIVLLVSDHLKNGCTACAQKTVVAKLLEGYTEEVANIFVC